MTDVSLKQFVPSTVCLKCDGCCRYKETDSAWRPKLGQNDKQNLAALITAPDALDQEGYIKTNQACSGHSCRFLNSQDNTCSVYAKRPFECSLYPFVLSCSIGKYSGKESSLSSENFEVAKLAQTPLAVKVYVHLSCPYVQDHLNSADFDGHVDYLKVFFSRRDVREFLTNNKSMLHDYTPYAQELRHLFDLSFL